MVTTDLTIDIKRRRADVYAFLMDYQNYLLWTSNLVELSATHGMEVGSRLTFVAMGLGRRVSLRAEVTANDGRTSFTVVSRQGPITFESAYTLGELRDQTSVNLRNRIDPGTIFRMAEGVLQSIGQTKYEADLKTLKSILEVSQAGSDQPHLFDASFS